jgi:hypothetical protein
MDKTKMGLVGAITSLAAAGAMGAQAAPQPVERAHSYAELLEPIPNAVERLALVNSASQPDGARLIEAQYYPDGPMAHHHHHHHRRHWRRRHYHHHHHHHHHNNY